MKPPSKWWLLFFAVYIINGVVIAIQRDVSAGIQIACLSWVGGVFLLQARAIAKRRGSDGSSE